MTFKELKSKVEEIKYSDLLQTDEWKNRRRQIILRDKSYCTICGNSATFWFDGELYAYNKFMEFEMEVNGRIISYIDYSLCDDKINLHVHHKRYVIGRLPWEYEDEELVTLCDSCHWNLHQKEKVKVFADISNVLVEMNFHTCRRCNGAGVFPEYSHIQNGVCFECNGAKYQELIGKPVVIGYV